MSTMRINPTVQFDPAGIAIFALGTSASAAS